MDERVKQSAPVTLRFHLAVLDRAVRFLEAELLSIAPAESFAAQEARVVAQEAREALRLLTALAGRPR